MGTRDELYAKVTATIIGQLETADPHKWSAPWHAAGDGLPTNATTHKPYRGVNVWLLLAEEMERGYLSSQWATYKQWGAVGGQVRRGEKAATVLLWKPATRKARAEGENDTEYLLCRSFSVFNLEQVDGVDALLPEPRNPIETVDGAERFLAAANVDVRHGGTRAYYTPALDTIQMPNRDTFTNSIGYYSTLAHETVHATGHDSRVGRDLTGRFGTAAYAAEELVAELGAAYICGMLGLTNSPREDHAHYLRSWIGLLKDDPSALVTAASQAQKAVDWLSQRQPAKVSATTVAA